MSEFNISRSMRKSYQDKLINNDWKHCFVCGKPSDGEASQWHNVPLCSIENGNKCLHEFDKMLMKEYNL